MWGTDHSSQPTWLGALIDRGTEAIAAIGADGTLLYANVAAHALLGFADGALVGTDATDLVHPDDLDRVAINLDGWPPGPVPAPA